jgi:DNA-binding NarL/FixJ family response regulator
MMGNNPSIPIIIISNSQIMCSGLTATLPSYLDITLLAIFASGDDPPQADQHKTFADATILLDSGIGQRAVLHWVKIWQEIDATISLILLEMSDDVKAILACIEAGISGYVLCGSTIEEVANRIKQVRNGKTHCSPEVAAELFARVSHISQSLHRVMQILPVELTPRQFKVLRLVAQGMNNQEIANELFITVHTVKHHVHQILAKLDCHHRREAVKYACQRGWLETYNLD